MSAHPRVVHKRRATITALPLYLSGHILKKNYKEKDFRRYYGELRGAALFLYTDDTQETYTEKLDLEQMKCPELDSSFNKKAQNIFTLALQTGEVQLKLEDADKAEEWRGYILTVVKKEIPKILQLLPGQRVQLEEALAQERRRNPQAPPLPPRPSVRDSPPSASSPMYPDMPECFYNVTRQEAEEMLESNPEHGSIIIRPSTMPNNYALTIRQQMPSGPVIKNYRVTSTNLGFVIELEEAVTVSSLNDVLQYFLKKTEYRLQPYTGSQSYDTFIEAPPTPKCVSVPSPTSKTVPKAPTVRYVNKKEVLPSPAKQEDEYVVPDDAPEDHNKKRLQFDGELRQILKMRRENIYSATDA